MVNLLQIVICCLFTTEHLGVHKNSLKRVHEFQIKLLEMLVLRRVENQSARRETSRSNAENQQQIQPTYGVDAGIWTRVTLVGASALTTAPPLLAELDYE